MAVGAELGILRIEQFDAFGDRNATMRGYSLILISEFAPYFGTIHAVFCIPRILAVAQIFRLAGVENSVRIFDVVDIISHRTNSISAMIIFMRALHRELRKRHLFFL